MTDIHFCDNCDNLLFIFADNDEKLYLSCKLCGLSKSMDDSKCIFNSETNIKLSEIINNNKYISNDITLPIIENNPNIKCPNKNCNEKHKSSKISYIKYDNDHMKFLYICKYCNQKWTNN